jgi:DNA-binding NarL/FixJ family response regulator
MGTPAPNSSRTKVSKNHPHYAGTRGSVLIVDDSAEWRTRVREILEEQPELQIVAEACDGSEGVRRAEELHPDLVLLDIGMPVVNGLVAADQIQRISSQSKIVFLTQENDIDIQSAALAAGAHGYVLKTNAQSKLLSTIAAVLRDGDSTDAV